MRVVLVSLSDLAAMQTYLYQGLDALVRIGVDAHAIGSRRLKTGRLPDSRTHLVTVSDSPRPSPASLLQARKGAKEISATIASLEPDVVHFLSKHTWNYLIAAQLRRTTRARIVHTFHDPVGHAGDGIRGGVVLYNKLIQRHIDAVVVHSEQSLHEAVHRLGCVRPVHLAPLGILDRIEFSPPDRISNQLLIFGRINPYKGPELMPPIADAILDLNPAISLLIAGKPSSGVSADLLTTIASKPNVVARFEEIPQQDIEGIFSSSDAVLITHTSITQSGVIADAYAHSRPIVCFDIPGIGEHLPPGHDAVPSFDVTAYAAAAVDLTSDLTALRTASAEAWSHGLAKYSSDLMADRLRDIYEATAAGPGPR